MKSIRKKHPPRKSKTPVVVRKSRKPVYLGALFTMSGRTIGIFASERGKTEFNGKIIRVRHGNGMAAFGEAIIAAMQSVAATMKGAQQA